jgi:mannose-6-phosphate isomerase
VSVPPIPVIFEPIFKAKPWGGRELARLFDKRLPPEVPIGESWELADLPGDESRVSRGPLAGRKLGKLIEIWGRDLLGDAKLADGRFPLLIKFLDAREPLSIQVHPRPRADASKAEQAGVKHEAWYVVDADPGAVLYLGLKPGVGPADVRAARSSPVLAKLHQLRPGEQERCYYLPSGVPHALGAGLVVAEVQTPSDVTYRLYDWDRLGLDGQPRELHVEQALANIRYNVAEEEIVQPRRQSSDMGRTIERLVTCEKFLIDRVRFDAAAPPKLPIGELAVWIVLSGSGKLVRDRDCCDFTPGDVLLIPANAAGVLAEMKAPGELLDVRIPTSAAAASGST